MLAVGKERPSKQDDPSFRVGAHLDRVRPALIEALLPISPIVGTRAKDRSRQSDEAVDKSPGGRHGPGVQEGEGDAS
jgi:hypothetical protein